MRNPRAAAGLAEAKPEAVYVQAPPDATLFRAGGVDYYLYMGAAEMRALQREWGVVLTDGDAPEEYHRKFDLYQTRLDFSGVLEDDVTMIRIGLSRWHHEASAAAPQRLRVLTNDDVFKTLEELEPEPGDDGKAPFLRIAALRRRFLRDMFGVKKKAEEGADPNAPSGRASSTLSSS